MIGRATCTIGATCIIRATCTNIGRATCTIGATCTIRATCTNLRATCTMIGRATCTMIGRATCTIGATCTIRATCTNLRATCTMIGRATCTMIGRATCTSTRATCTTPSNLHHRKQPASWQRPRYNVQAGSAPEEAGRAPHHLRISTPPGARLRVITKMFAAKFDNFEPQKQFVTTNFPESE
jgi:hypothetical protein